MKPHGIMVDLREIREANNITQGTIGMEAGYNRVEISLFEAGRRDPRLSAVSNIAESLGYELVLRRK